ncbi:hypothetical protein LCGC14_3052320, partial [marine sediment metagenome]
MFQLRDRRLLPPGGFDLGRA